MTDNKIFSGDLVILALIIFCMVIGGSFIERSNLSHVIHFNSYETTNIQEQESTLIDSVYTIESPYDVIEFDALWLSQYVDYVINLSVVSPHSCLVNVSIIDPSLSYYNINERELGWLPPREEHITLSFGTALEGNYRVVFSFRAEYNLNVHISLTAENGCFETQIMSYGVDYLLFYRVTKFTAAYTYIEHNIWLNTEFSYRFFMGIVTPLANEGNIVIPINYSIKDPKSIVFMMYDNFNLSSNLQLNEFTFKTAQSGIHVIRLELQSDIPLNLGYFVLHHQQNLSEPENPSSNHPISNLFVPGEIFLIVIIFVILIFLGLLVVLKNHQGKNNQTRKPDICSYLLMGK